MIIGLGNDVIDIRRIERTLEILNWILVAFILTSFLVLALVGCWITFRGRASWRMLDTLRFRQKIVVLAVFLVALNEMFRQAYEPFLYFQF